MKDNRFRNLSPLLREPSQVSLIAQPPPANKRHIQILLRWRWLVLVINLSLVLLIEISEGHWWDTHAWIEVLLYGVIIPFTTWLILTLLAHTIVRRAEIERNLERHRRLTRQLAQHQEWDELTQFVAEFPRTVLPVRRSSLFIYDHHKARLESVADSQATNAPLVLPVQWPDVCKACLTNPAPELRRVVECRRARGAAESAYADAYCLPLSYHRVIVGFLRIVFEPGCRPTPNQIEFIRDAAPEIALALALSIAQPRQMAYVRVEAQQDERRRIACELHSSLAQQIGYLHLSLDRLTSAESHIKDEASRRELEHMREVANEAYEQIRGNLAILRSWEKADLVQAITDYVQVMAERTELKLELKSDGEASLLPPQVCQRVFGLVQEGLRNVEKHARARLAYINLGWSTECLRIDVIDDGIGFDPSAVRQGHYGLTMMRENIEKLRGELVINSGHGEGTRLRFKVPLPQHQMG